MVTGGRPETERERERKMSEARDSQRGDKRHAGWKNETGVRQETYRREARDRQTDRKKARHTHANTRTKGLHRHTYKTELHLQRQQYDFLPSQTEGCGEGRNVCVCV